MESRLARFHPDVISFVRPPFTLRDDLARLLAVQEVGATEGMILYGTRALDALAAAALERACLSATGSLYWNLSLLQHYYLMPAVTQYWAHALRRLGNDVRHIRRPILPRDGELALILLERVLQWFFCLFPLGPQLPALVKDGIPPFSISEDMRGFVLAFEQPDSDPLQAAKAWLRQPANLRSSALAAILAERLLECDACDAAATVLRESLEADPDDVRLRQLRGILNSRQGDMWQALSWLEPLYANADHFKDEETAGVIAGVYKRAWLAEREQTAWLSRAHDAYFDAWTTYSGKQNAYLGVNAAATALWLGRPAVARNIAAEVVESQRRRQHFVAAQFGTAPCTFWDYAGMAEAFLLAGRFREARAEYQAACTAFATQRGMVEVACAQAAEILRALGVTCGIEEWLAHPLADAPVLTVGVTGHRILPDDPALGAALRNALAAMRQKYVGGGRLQVMTLLAEGADQLAAGLALAAGDALHAMLPMELEAYRKDFAPATLATFHALLNQADRVTIATPRWTAERAQAYAHAGRCMVENCDVLLAVWDGAPSHGPGGTAEVVTCARRLGRPVYWISVRPPFECIPLP